LFGGSFSSSFWRLILWGWGWLQVSMLNDFVCFSRASARHVVHTSVSNEMHSVAFGAHVWVGVVLVHACVHSGVCLRVNVCSCAREVALRRFQHLTDSHRWRRQHTSCDIRACLVDCWGSDVKLFVWLYGFAAHYKFTCGPCRSPRHETNHGISHGCHGSADVCRGSSSSTCGRARLWLAGSCYPIGSRVRLKVCDMFDVTGNGSAALWAHQCIT